MFDGGAETRLILADGIVLNKCECGYYKKTLWCYLKDISFSEAFAYFDKPEAYHKIIFDMGFQPAFFDRIIYDGFTDVTALQKEEDRISVRLEGDHIDITEQRIYTEEERDDDDGTIHNPDQNEP